MTAPSSRRRDGAGLVDDEPVIETDPNLPPVALSAEHEAKSRR